MVITLVKKPVPERHAIEAIETEWHGYHFRSRLEARHAIVLDYLNLVFEYEREGYRFPDGTCYLCDYHIDKQDCWIGDACWLEVKGQEPTNEEEHKAELLAKYSKRNVYIFFGECWLPADKAERDHDGGYLYRPDGSWENFQWLYQCPRCQKYGIGLFGQSVDSPCGCPKPTLKQNDYNEKIMAAFRKARGMRFDKKEETKE
jgi:hypothetical protein